MSSLDKTMYFNFEDNNQKDVRETLETVYDALEKKGYNPINQIVGYILSEDPTYITNHNHARTLIRKIDRDELLQVLVKSYLPQFCRATLWYVGEQANMVTCGYHIVL